MTIDEKIKELEETLAEFGRAIGKLKGEIAKERMRKLYEIAGETEDYKLQRQLVDKIKQRAYINQNRITYQQLKDIALRLNKGQEIYWHNGSQDKYYIYFDYIENEFGLTFANSMRSLSGIYCLDEKYLDIAIDEIGEEKLKQLLEWGL